MLVEVDAPRMFIPIVCILITAANNKCHLSRSLASSWQLHEHGTSAGR